MASIVDSVIRAATQAAPAGGHPWPESLERRIAHTAGRPGIILAPLRADALAARLTAALATPAFELDGTVWAHPALLGSPARDRVLAHEAAHVLQRQASAGGGAAVFDGVAEAEAEAFAEALFAGRACRIRARPGLPALQPGWPLIALLLAAGIGFTWAGFDINRSREERRRAERLPTERRSPHLHETGWGMVPFVGSADQLWNGENWATQVGGACFLVLDLSLVGGFAARGLARGVMYFSTRAALREGLAEVGRGGGTVLQRAALTELAEGAAEGTIRMGSEAEIEQALRAQVLNTPGTYVIAGTTGAGNHSITLLVTNGQVYKIHGSIMRLVQDVAARPITEQMVQGWSREFNRMTIFGLERGMGDAMIANEVRFWQGFQGGLTNQGLQRLLAQGCSGTQAVLLERLGLFNATASERMLPFLMDRGMAARAGGASYVVNSWRAARGTARQLTLYGGSTVLSEAFRGVPMLQAPTDVTPMHNIARAEAPGVVVERGHPGLVTLSPSYTAGAGRILFPDNAVFRSSALATVRVGFATRAAGGTDGRMPVPPPGLIYDDIQRVCRVATPDDYAPSHHA